MVSKGKVCNAGHCPSSSSSNSGQPPLACFLIPSPQRCFAPRLHRVKLADLLEENADFFFPEKDSFLMDDGFQCCKQTLFNKFVSYFFDHIKKQVLKSFFLPWARCCRLSAREILRQAPLSCLASVWFPVIWTEHTFCPPASLLVT